MQYDLVQLWCGGVSQMSLHSTATGNTWRFRYLIETTIIKNIVKFAAIIRWMREFAVDFWSTPTPVISAYFPYCMWCISKNCRLFEIFDKFSQNDIYIYIYIYLYIHIYTGCPRRNVPDFGRVFLMLKYTDITQNTCVQSWTVTEIMARKVWNFDSCYTLIDYQIHIETGRNMWFL